VLRVCRGCRRSHGATCTSEEVKPCLVVVCDTIGRGRCLAIVGHDNGRAEGYPNLAETTGRVSFYGSRAGIRRGERVGEKVTLNMVMAIADREERYDRVDVLARLIREKCWKVSLAFTCSATTTAVPTQQMQDSASTGVAVACCFVTASRQQPISSPPRSFSFARIVHWQIRSTVFGAYKVSKSLIELAYTPNCHACLLSLPLSRTCSNDGVSNKAWRKNAVEHA
jgi:hypothetical protein